MRSLLLTTFLALALASPLVAETVPEVQVPPDHFTKGELTSFRATSSYDETLAFARRLEKTSPFVKLDFYGTSGEGRPMPVLYVSKDKSFTPEEAKKTGKPIILVLNGIHSGEIDGKEASFIFVRDLIFRRHPEVLENLILLIVPIYNVDGHERVSKWNRPNQDGPIDGMGFRTNARGLDLNRDFLKADAPETRGLLSLVRTWDPDLFLDQHVTDGANYQATLTLFYGSEPFTSAPLVEWLKATMPPVLDRVENRGFKSAPYIDFIDWNDPMKGIDLGPSRPRYSSGYLPLRQTPNILVEMHSIKPFGDRVRGNEAFMVELFDQLAKSPKSLLDARQKAKKEAREAALGSPFPLVSETDLSRPRDYDLESFEFYRVTSPVTGQPAVRWDSKKPKTLRIPIFENGKATFTAPRPAGYLVPPGWPGVEERLLAHGLAYQKLSKSATLAVGTFRATGAKFAKSSYQGRVRVEATIARGKETRKIPAGTLYIPLDTDLYGIAMHLFEPEGPDSFFSWGEFSSALESKEWIDTRVLDPLAEEIMKKDPAVKAEWEAKLKDPAFAKDAEKRRRFFYSKTPYWDETFGLLPVYRVEAPLSESLFSPPGPSSSPVVSPR